MQGLLQAPPGSSSGQQVSSAPPGAPGTTWPGSGAPWGQLAADTCRISTAGPRCVCCWQLLPHCCFSKHLLLRCFQEAVAIFVPCLYLSACPRIIFHPSSAIQPLWLQNLSQCFCWKCPFSLASVVLSENQCFNCITLVPYIYLVALNLLKKKKKKSLSCLHCCHHFVRKYLSLQTAS